MPAKITWCVPSEVSDILRDVHARFPDLWFTQQESYHYSAVYAVSLGVALAHGPRARLQRVLLRFSTTAGARLDDEGPFLRKRRFVAELERWLRFVEAQLRLGAA